MEKKLLNFKFFQMTTPKLVSFMKKYGLKHQTMNKNNSARKVSIKVYLKALKLNTKKRFVYLDSGE